MCANVLTASAQDQDQVQVQVQVRAGRRTSDVKVPVYLSVWRDGSPLLPEHSGGSATSSGPALLPAAARCAQEQTTGRGGSAS